MRISFIMEYHVLDSLKRTKFSKLAGVYATEEHVEKAKSTFIEQYGEDGVSFSVKIYEQLI